MIEVHAERCPQKHACPTVRVGPTSAITQRGNAAPEIDDSRCIDFGKCLRTCAAFAPRDEPN